MGLTDIDEQRKVDEQGESAMNRAMLFDEREIVEMIIPYLQKQLNIQHIQLETVEEGLEKAKDPSNDGYDAKMIEAAEPGSPASMSDN